MSEPILSVKFFSTASGKEPVRDFLQNQTAEDRKTIGTDIKTIQLGWPLGMPLVRKLDDGLWEVRSTINDGIVRVLFTVDSGQMVLLHSFVKKDRKTPKKEMQTAVKRLKSLRNLL